MELHEVLRTQRVLAVLRGDDAPGEVVAATAAGATAVKLFPAGSVGPAHLAQLRGPFPVLDVVPTGGVDVEGAEEWLAQGALAVGLSTALCSPGDIRRRDWDTVLGRVRAVLRPPARA